MHPSRLLLPSLCLFAAAAAGQAPWQWSYCFRDAYVVTPVGDVDGDQHPDFLAGNPELNTDRGYAALVSGKEFRVLVEWQGAANKALFGTAIVAGDWNGDSIVDWIISAPGDAGGLGTVTGYDGKTRQAMFVKQGTQANAEFGATLCLADVYPLVPDGKPDLLVGSPAYDASPLVEVGHVALYDNVNLNQVQAWVGNGDRHRYGTALVSNGNLDGKPGEDVIVTAKGYYSSTSGCGGGYFEMISGGFIQVTRYNGPARECFGSAVLVDDVDADNQKELVVGTGFNNRLGKAVVYEWSNGTWTAGNLFTGRGADLRNLGRCIVRMPDQNQDGIADLVIAGSHTVEVFAGKTYLHLFSFAVSELMDVAFVGDLSRDGIPDLLVGAPRLNNYPAFRHEVGVWSPRTWQLKPQDNYVRASAGARIQIDIDMGAVHAGNLYLLLGSLSGTTPGTPLGTVALPLNVDPFLMLMTALFNNAPFVNFAGLLDGQGKATAYWQAAPVLGKFAPLHIDHAVLVLGYPTPSFAAASNARHVVLLP